MHYYQFNIGDYLSHTRHLDYREDIIYRRALDYYYLHEKPLPLDYTQLARLLCMPKDLIDLVENIMTEFFVRTDDGFINPRADEEIKKYQSFAEAGRKGADKRWKKDSPPISPPNATPMLNNNHKPITNKQYKPPIPAELYADYMKVRKAKKAGDLTETAFAGIAREAEKAGITVEDAIKQCCERGWVGFKAEWIKQDAVKNESQAWRTDDELMLKKAKELGVHTTGKSRFEIIAAIDKKRGAV